MTNLQRKIGGDKALNPYNPRYRKIKEWLKDFLMGRLGNTRPTRSCPVSYAELAKQLACTTLGEQCKIRPQSYKTILQECVRELRMNEQFPISGVGKGLWVCQSEEDVAEYKDSLQDRIDSQVNLLSQVKKWKV